MGRGGKEEKQRISLAFSSLHHQPDLFPTTDCHRTPTTDPHRTSDYLLVIVGSFPNNQIFLDNYLMVD
ncbi:hypothetical protein KFK09_011481 [Dendrobium nobile]|uniref:Uncharacterized protein n=1 Tax=Dendrobium nobile TaxID=94219 RepID=A0A8T3BFW9_DENNO|nr:hypothetical protein KFK09_011481 [Dendrobium nobile]